MGASSRLGQWASSAPLTRCLNGQATVEVALVMCFLLIPLIVGSIDIGRAYFSYDLLVHAVNEGARWGSFDHDTATIKATVQTAGSALALQASDVTVTCYSGASTTTKLCTDVVNFDVIRVRGSFVFQPITPWASTLMPGGQLTLQATAQRTFQ